MSVRLFAMVLALVGPPPEGTPTRLQLKQGDQIVAIGDSITAEGGYLKMTDAVLAQNCPDLNQLFLDVIAKKPAGEQGAWLAHDGVHMNDRGNAVMAIALLRALGVAKPYPDTSSTCESENLLATGEPIKTNGKFLQATRFGSNTEDLTAFGIKWSKWPGTPAAKYHRQWGNYEINTTDAKGNKFTGAGSELVKWILGVNYGTISGTFSDLTPPKRYRAQFIVHDNHSSRDEGILCAGIRAGELETRINKNLFPLVVTFEWTATRASEEWICSGREGQLVGFALFELDGTAAAKPAR